MNGNEIYQSDHTILVNPGSGDVDVTVIPLGAKLGDVFRVIPMLHGVIPWLFTKSDTKTYGKGFDLVGDRMVAKTLINFVGDPSKNFYRIIPHSGACHYIRKHHFVEMCQVDSNIVACSKIFVD